MRYKNKDSMLSRQQSGAASNGRLSINMLPGNFNSIQLSSARSSFIDKNNNMNSDLKTARSIVKVPGKFK